MRWSLLAATLLSAVGGAGCLDKTPPPVAPDELDENLRWFWVNGDALDDAALRGGAAKLAVAGKADSRTAPLKGQSRIRLSPEDVAVVGLEGADPSTARGLLVVNLFHCTLERLQNIVIAQDQKSQYAGVYDGYSRVYTSDADAFVAGTTNVITWDTEAKASLPINDPYTSQLKGGLRRVPDVAESATRGPFLIARTWLTAPATFGAGSASSFRQDYQIEVFWEQSSGRIFHAYGMWRDIKVGAFDLSIEDDGMMNIILGNLVDWDTRTAELCGK